MSIFSHQPCTPGKKKKKPSFEISLALFPRRAKIFFFFPGKFDKTPLVFFRAAVL